MLHPRKHSTRLAVWAVSLSTLVASAADRRELPSAKPESVGMSSEKLAKVSASLKGFVDDEKVSGAIAIVVRKGRVVYFQSFGSRDVEAGKPMEKDSILRFYSMTKPITTVAAMTLVEEGKLELDADVTRYVSQFKQLKVLQSKQGDELQVAELDRPVTIRDLMRHTAGMTYGFFSNTAVDQEYLKAGILSGPDSLQQTVEKLAKIPLLYQPATRFHYSVASDVLGHVVEVVSGMNLGEFFRGQIFEPLDMPDTAFEVPRGSADRLATVYSPKTGGGLSVDDAAATSRFLRKPAMCSGGGGLVSTARDYSRFCQMMLNGGELDGNRVLKAATVADMIKDQLPASAFPISMGLPLPGVGFGLGFSVVVKKPTPDSTARLGEYGRAGAASTHLWIPPRDDLAVVVLSQRSPFSSQLSVAVKPLVYDAIE